MTKFTAKYGLSFLGGPETAYSETKIIKGHIGSCTGGSGETWGILSAYVRRTMDYLGRNNLLHNPVWMEKPVYEQGRITMFGLRYTYDKFLRMTGKRGDDLPLKNAKPNTLVAVDIDFETKKLFSKDEMNTILHCLAEQSGHAYGFRKDWF